MGQEEIIPYEEVFQALNRAKIDYLVCGGTAVVMFGFARLTVDLDLVVSLKRENLSKLYDMLSGLGYKTRIPIKKSEFIQKEILAKLEKEKNMKVVSFYDPKDNFKTIDIGVNLPNIDQILRRKKIIKVRNFNIPIIFIDDLIKMKEFPYFRHFRQFSSLFLTPLQQNTPKKSKEIPLHTAALAFLSELFQFLPELLYLLAGFLFRARIIDDQIAIPLFLLHRDLGPDHVHSHFFRTSVACHQALFLRLFGGIDH